MQAGRLNQRIHIQAIGEAYDELGEPIPGTWQDIAVVWADIRHLSGLEAVKSNVDVSIIKASIRIRYRPGITAAMRIIHNTTVYDIQAVLMDAAGRQFTDLICQAGANQG